MIKPAVDDGLTTHVLDLLEPWCEVNPRRMFGGIGLFAFGQMFAIIIDDVVYLKDTINQDGTATDLGFEKEYFEYNRNGKTVRLGYFKAPGRAMEESVYLIELAKSSYNGAALKKKPLKKKAASTQKVPRIYPPIP